MGIVGGTVMGDDSDGGAGARWMTYGELAEARGTSRASAIRQAQRRRWPRRPGNDGTVRVLVPMTDLAEPATVAQTVTGTVAPTVAPDLRDVVEALERAHAGEVTALRGQVEQAEARAGVERDRADRAERRADLADADRRAAEARADRAEARARAAEEAPGAVWSRRVRRAWAALRGA